MKFDVSYSVGSKIGKHFLVHQVLLGGMGEVYLCLDTEKNLPYALKTFQNRFLNNLHIREAFKSEIRTWISLEKHPHIVRCHRMEVLDGQPFALLDWIAAEEGRGTDLRGWLHSGPLNVKLALEVGLDVCRGLFHAGQKQPGIVHRDLKPENILMAQGPIAKITDWGLARVVQRIGMEVREEDNQTRIRHSLWGEGGIAGTPAYMAPEQWQAGPLDVRTDIYAFGCTLYEMLTSYRPYQASTPSGYRRQHLEAPIPVLFLEDQASSELDQIIARCLAKDAGQRYQTVNELLQSMEAVYRSRFSSEPRVLDDKEEMTARDLINRGLTYTLLDNYDDALADLDQAIIMGEELAHAYINRGIVYTSLNRHLDALADFDRAKELDPMMPHIYINRAAALQSLQRIDEALLNVERAIELNPMFPQAYANRGLIYQQLKQHEKALANFNYALEIDSYDSKNLSNRGLVYQAMGRYDEALEDFNRSIELDPTNGYAYACRGHLLYKLQRFTEAQSDLHHAIQFHHAPQDIYIWSGELQKALGNYDKALEAYSKLINFSLLHENDQSLSLTAAYLQRAILLVELNRYEEAIVEFDHLIELDSANKLYYESRGDAYGEIGNYEQALGDYARSMELDPNRAATYRKRGIAFYEMGDYDRALEDFWRSIELNQRSPEPHFNIGLILSLRGELTEALMHFEKSVELGYDRGAQFAADIRQQLGRSK